MDSKDGTQRQLSIDLLQALVPALRGHEMPARVEYRVPGSNLFFDCYIPTLPRSAIDIRFCSDHDKALRLVRDARNSLVHSRRPFSENLLYFIVFFGEIDIKDISTSREFKQFGKHLGLELVYGGPLSDPLTTLAINTAAQINIRRASHAPLITLGLDQIREQDLAAREPVIAATVTDETSSGDEPVSFYSYATSAVAHPDDGTFVLERLVVPARLGLRSMPSGWTIKEVRVDGVDVTYEHLQVRNGAAHVEIRAPCTEHGRFAVDSST